MGKVVLLGDQTQPRGLVRQGYYSVCTIKNNGYVAWLCTVMMTIMHHPTHSILKQCEDCPSPDHAKIQANYSLTS